MVQGVKVNLIPENKGALRDLLLFEKEGALCTQREVQAGDVKDWNEGCLCFPRSL